MKESSTLASYRAVSPIDFRGELVTRNPAALIIITATNWTDVLSSHDGWEIQMNKSIRELSRRDEVLS